MLKALTVKWNRDRGLLDNYDPSLELRMLSEEAKEFYAAETLAHMLAEYADFQFVLDGTKAKFGSQVISSHIDIDLRVKTYNDIMSWAGKVMADMYNCLSSVLDEHRHGHRHELDGLINMASSHVISCNNLKGLKKDEEGKIQKDENHVDPKDLIEAELDRLGF